MSTPAFASVATPFPRQSDEPAVVFENVSLAFDDKVILDGISFTLLPGRMKIIMGASGAGKSTILRLILGLLKADAGRIWVEGQRVDDMSETDLMKVRANLGMVFQEGALFDSITVGENVAYRLLEDNQLDEADIDERVHEMLGFVGLADFAHRMPSELSGGQRRRVAVARALVAQPRIMLYDEPTTGLDPITATTITDLIVKVRDLDGVSSILVTHQLRDAFNVARTFMMKRGDSFEASVVDDMSTLEGTEFLMLREGHMVFEGATRELQRCDDPYIREFLS